MALAALIKDGGVGEQVVDALEVLAHADRPGHRGALDLEHVLDFVEHLDGVAHFPVQLVDERQDRRVAQPAHLHQFHGALFHALGGVDHHQGGVHRRQGAIGVLGEVGMAGGVQQVDHGVPVGELHYRGGHRDAPFLFHLHPVRGGVHAGLLALHGTRHADQVAVQQHLLGDGGFTGVRVGDDGEGAPFIDLVGGAHRFLGLRRRALYS